MTTAAEYLERAKTEEFAEQLESQGYKVSRELRLGGVIFDLVAEKGASKLFFEFIFRKNSADKAKQLVQLRRVALENGATEFKPILFDVPRLVEVEIEWLEEVLSEVLESEEAQEQVNDVANGVSFNGVYVGAITSIKMDEDGIRVAGMAEVDVDIFMGPSKDGIEVSENFSFTYDITVDYERRLQEVHGIAIDSSSFYGQDEDDEPDDEEDSSVDPDSKNNPF